MYGLTIGMLGATPPVPLPLLLLFVVVDTTELLGSEDELVTLLLLELFVLVLFETALEDVTPVLLFSPVLPYTFCELFW
uniref:Uncharacterized protein n=1 Tax=Anopheles braziliensis TaxID=58242 RepID=A0A2M3ZLI4_9DIPT